MEQIANYQKCIQQLESIMADINFGIDKLPPNCQNLIILNTTHGPPIHFNQFFEEQIEISYFYPLNKTTQLLMLPIKDNTKSDLVRDYTFKYFARQCPNAKIQIVYLIQSNLIDNIDTILLNDFSNLPNSNGLLIFFYDTPNEMVEWDQFKILKLIQDQNGRNTIISSFIKEISSNRINHLSNNQISDITNISKYLEFIPGKYTTQEIENLFSVDQQCKNQLILYQKVFQEYFNEKIQIFLKEIINHFYKFQVTQFFEQLQKLKDIEDPLQQQIDMGQNLMEKIQNIFQHLKPQISKNILQDIKKYQEIVSFFKIDNDIGQLLAVQFNIIQISKVISEKILTQIKDFTHDIEPEPQQHQSSLDSDNDSEIELVSLPRKWVKLG